MRSVTNRSAITAKVIGRVQGVGFRYTTADVARELGLTGWVRNTPDGGVQVRAQGDERILERFVAFLEEGPRAARVASVDVHPAAFDPALEGFTVRS
jgi:acylphosphatase